MLVLSRYRHERIVINPGPDQIVIELVDIDRDKVRIGISAPQSYRIWREEIVPGLPPAAVVEPGPSLPPMPLSAPPSFLARHADHDEPGEGP